ncbi:MAG: hypothetical protein KC912_08275 [Proteobacteria bacterium]|nr:hypothetical protein [Pseudomonadota bacterium]
MKLSCTITPGLSPMDRGYVEDMLGEALSDQLGMDVDPVGGGTMIGDPPVSDFEFDLSGPASADTVHDVWKTVFSGIPFTLATTITLSLDDAPQVTIVVGGPAECS